MNKLTINSTILLPRSNAQLPVFQLGVYQSASVANSVKLALLAGYRGIDSATIYRNEEEVGHAVEAWKEDVALAKRNDTVPVSQDGGELLSSEIWLTSKITSKGYGTAKTTKAVNSSVDKIAPAQWSLYLLHDPTAGREKRLEAWKVLESKVEEGVLKSIGVSNFSDVHLEEFKAAGVSVPEVNQIELHPFCQQKPIVDYCRRAGIVVQAYSPLVRGSRFDDPIICEISTETGKSAAQVLIRWSLQKGFVTLPKSDTPARIIENSQVFDFELTTEQMARLDSLDEGSEGACTWNPVNHV